MMGVNRQKRKKGEEHTFSVPPETRRVPLSFIARAYTDSLWPLAAIGLYPRD